VKILVLGSGAREHAIVKALIRTGTPASNIIVAPGNAGMAQEVQCVAMDANDPKLVTEFATGNKIELAIIGPEAPLVAGVSDALRAANIPVFGPSQKARL